MMVDQTSDTKKGPLAQIQHYWHIVFKWKWTAMIVLLTVMTATLLFTFLTAPVYTASGSVWIDDNPKILPFQEIQTFGAGSNLQSHARLLQSRALAAEVIEKLRLFEKSEFGAKPSKKNDPIDTLDPIFREHLIQNFMKTISVSPVPGTRLVDVKFRNRNPKIAADTLNALFDGFIDMLVRKRNQASELATEFLNAQLATLRTEISEREKKLSQIGSEKGILPLTVTEAPTVAKLAEINKSLTDATIDRINKFNRYNQIKSAPLGEIPDAPTGGLIQKLREEYRTLSREYAKRLATLTPEYPEMTRLKSEIDAAGEALRNEIQNMVSVAYSDYQAALTKELSLQNLLDDLKKEAYKVSGNSVLYNSFRIELENKKILLESLSKRQNEIGLSARLNDLDAVNVWIVDRANYPLRPSSPNKRKNVLLGILIGIAGGLGLVLGLEYLNQTVKTSKDIAVSTGLPTLGVIPSFEVEIKSKGPGSEFSRIANIIRGSGKENKKKTRAERPDSNLGGLGTDRPSADRVDRNCRGNSIELIAIRKPHSIQSESYRSIRTTLFVSSPPGKIKSILFTSSLAGEGKSSTVSNVGIALASANIRVVIVDADLRKPQQRAIFKRDEGPGLTRFLSTHDEPTNLAMPTQVPNLYLIHSGPLPPDPLELLTSAKMEKLIIYLKSNFDYILVDTPPILAVSDALALGPIVDAIILISRGGQTPIQALKQAKQKLDAHKLKCLGVILNGVDLIEQDGYYSRQYSNYYKTD